RGGDRRQRAGAHPVDREARDRLREPGEEGDVAAERQALVAYLGRGRERHVVDPVERQLRVSPEELAHDLHGHIVRPRPPEEPGRPGLPEGRADAVDVDHLAQLARHASSSLAQAEPSSSVLGRSRGLAPCPSGGYAVRDMTPRDRRSAGGRADMPDMVRLGPVPGPGPDTAANGRQPCRFSARPPWPGQRVWSCSKTDAGAVGWAGRWRRVSGSTTRSSPYRTGVARTRSTATCSARSWSSSSTGGSRTASATSS